MLCFCLENHRSHIFVDKTVAANKYLDLFQLYALPHLPDGTIYQQDGAPLHFANIVRTVLDISHATNGSHVEVYGT